MANDEEFRTIAAEEPWRVGEHYAIHVYQGERPVATFQDPLDAEMAVDAVNNRTLVLISPEMIRDTAQAIRDSNLTPSAKEAWQQHPQLVPAHVYAEAALASLYEQGYVIAKAPKTFGPKHAATCPRHKAVQHRDGKEPWCGMCGLTEDHREPQGGIAKSRPLRSVAVPTGEYDYDTT